MTFSDRYRLDDDVWKPHEKYLFQYSDGDDTENYILEALQRSKDLSTGSPELFFHIKDWPSLYHLSPRRADLLRPLVNLLKEKTILEIGSGCGAITRFLGELNAEVLALEGSPRRAKITRERCRDLGNITVIADNFNDFETAEKFDCITLIGVLEYSNLFIKADNPPMVMLQKIKKHLKPGGFVIIAIENKLGLKYLAGAPEDYLGVAFAGIEDRYNSETAVTFGKKELNDLLLSTGLENTCFLYPFPDYKLPVTIITENGLNNSGFDIPGLLLEKHEYIQGHYYNSFFNSSLVERGLHKNGLTADLANSFLVVAGLSNKECTDSSLLATSYSTWRQKPYCKSVEFHGVENDPVVISKMKLYTCSNAGDSAQLVLQSEEYKPGTLLLENLLQIISIKNWGLEQLVGWARQYYNILESNSIRLNGEIVLDGKYLDLTPFNIISRENEEPFIFDQEWDAGEPVPIDYVFFRGIYYSLGQIIFYSAPHQEIPRCILKVSKLLLKQITGIDCAVVEAYREKERKYFSAVWLQDYQPFGPEPMRIRHHELLQEEIHQQTSALGELEKVSEENQNLTRTVQQLTQQLESLLKKQLEEGLRKELTAKLREELSNEWKVQFSLQQEAHAKIQQDLAKEKDELVKEKSQLEKKNAELEEQRITLGKELQERESVLQDLQFNHNFTRQQLNEINNKLVTIYNSDGWKWLSRYYKLKGRFLNENSWHYKFLRKVVNFFRNRKQNFVTDGGSAIQFQSTSGIVSAQIDNIEPTSVPLPVYEKPEVSIVIPVYNAWKMNVRCINSIIENTTDISYELIVADDCSTDNTSNISQHYPNIIHIRNEKNLGFVLNCNNAASHARGKYIHFLNNDTEVKPGWLSSLAILMNKDELIGMTGSKLVYPDGRLQEAGGIIWNDASGWNFGNGQNPEMPEFNYVKEVDYISGASIMVRADLWKELGGFDTSYSPAYCEDSDLAFRLREKGFKVIYQPLSVVVHYEGYSHGTDTMKSEISSIKEYQRINNKKFYDKWKDVLQRDQFPNAENVFWARDRSRYQKTLLMVDHYVPQFDRDAGSRTTFQYLELFVKMGFNVKFLGENFYRHEPYTSILQQMGIEVLYGPWYADNWKQWFIENREKFDYVYLNRPHISVNFIDFIKENSKARIIYYGHDLHFLRKEKNYAVKKDKNILAEAKKWKEIELYLFSKSDVILTPSTDEQKIIQSLSNDFNVRLMRPYIYKKVNPPVNNFQNRKDIFFVGGFGHSPNVDGILWFVREVWPLIKKRMPEIRFIIAGSSPTQEIKDLNGCDDIIVKGYIGDDELEKLYTSCKMAIIPLRYGAGVKGKTVEAMYYGTPLVTTSFGVEGLPGDPSFLYVTDRAKEFAEQICMLYENEEKLIELSKKSVEYIGDNFSENSAKDILKSILIP